MVDDWLEDGEGAFENPGEAFAAVDAELPATLRQGEKAPAGLRR